MPKQLVADAYDAALTHFDLTSNDVLKGYDNGLSSIFYVHSQLPLEVPLLVVGLSYIFWGLIGW